jgi:AcrR family transcriptional regulator
MSKSDSTNQTRRDQQKAETRALILATAKALFVEKNYENTTIRVIAKQAGVAVGTVFVHFPDKSALLAAALYEDIEQVLAEAFATIPQTTLKAQLLHLAQSLYNYYAQNPSLSRTLVKESMFMGGEWGAILTGQIQRFIVEAAQLCRTAQAKGDMRSDLECDLVAQIFFSHYWLALFVGLQSEAVLPQMQTNLLEQLLAPLLNTDASDINFPN